MDIDVNKELGLKNTELERQLTKRNEQYIFDLKKSLMTANLSEEEQIVALSEMLPIIILEQKKGVTARQLFGTVSHRTEALLSQPKKQPQSTPLLMWLDNSLLIFGIMAIMFSLTMNLSKGNAQPMGLLTLILASLSGGYVFYLMYKYVWQYDRPEADRSKRPSWFKTTLLLVGAMILWIMIFSISTLIPNSINPVLDPIFVIIIGVVALIGRYFLKKKYNMQSSFVR